MRARVVAEGYPAPARWGVSTFAEFGLLPSLIEGLTALGLVTPTEIQRRAMPALLSGRSVAGVAETGSGKTLAYAVPLLNLVRSLEEDGAPVTVPAQPRAVVLVPARELGEQVAKVFKSLTHTTRVRVRPALATLQVARRSVAGPHEVLIGTPGRVAQLVKVGALSLADARIVVLDEVDQLLDLGFLPDVTAVFRACPAGRQLACFSATFPPAVEALIGKELTDAVVIKTTGSERLVATLTTLNHTVVDGKRWPVLAPLLEAEVPGGTLLFVNTREQCDAVAAKLTEAGHACVVYRGEMEKGERRKNLKAFRDGTVRLLVTTDLGSRGLDVENVGRVINVHLPREIENYLHRAGRTARAGRPGVVVNLVTERDRPLIDRLGGIAARRS